MCMRHKSPVTSSFHFSISDIVNTLYFKPKIHYTLRKCILLRARAYYVQPCVSVCMCCETAVSANCGGKRPQTAHTETHRLQSTIHLNLPIYVFSPPYQAPRGTTDSASFIHLQETFIFHQHPFIHPSPSFLMTSVICVVHQSLSGTQQQHLRLN